MRTGGNATWRLLTVVACALLVGCEEGGGPAGGDVGDNDINVVVAIGDSITEGFGLPPESSYPAQLAGMTGKTVINAGRDGERSAGGVSRTSGLLNRYKPGYLLILLGSNDISGGSDAGNIANNIAAMVRDARANRTIAIVGTIPPGFGPHAYLSAGAAGVNPTIVSVAQGEGARIADVYNAVNDPGYFQADGLHPNATGAGRVAQAFRSRL
jgi:acyl-CoA thioesterase-1